MNHTQQPSQPQDLSDPQLPHIRVHHPNSPRHHPNSPRHHSSSAATPTPTAGARRKLGVAVDLSDESAHAVRWAVDHYIRPGDAVILLHVSPTSVLFGADWGSVDLSINTNDDIDFVDNHALHDSVKQKKLENDFDAFTASKAADLAKPLREAQIPYKIHIVKDHDMKERLCLEVERLGLSAVIMGSRGLALPSVGTTAGWEVSAIIVYTTVFVPLLLSGFRRMTIAALLMVALVLLLLLRRLFLLKRMRRKRP